MDKKFTNGAKRIFASLLVMTLLTGTLPYTPVGDVLGYVAITANATHYDGDTGAPNKFSICNVGDTFDENAFFENNTGSTLYIRYDDYSYANEDVEVNGDYHFYVNSRLVSKSSSTWNFTSLRSETSIYKYPTVKSLILYDGKAKSFIQSAASVSGDQTVYYGVSTSQNSQPTNWYSDIDDLKVTATGKYYLWIKTDGNKTYKALSPTRCDEITVSNQASVFENRYFGNATGSQSNPFIISDTADWDFLCEALNYNDIFNRFDGKYFKLENNITVSKSAGSGNHDFCGNFDGNGKTLTFNCNSSEEYCAPFNYVTNTTSFRNLTINGTINTSKGYAAGLIGHLYGTVTIEKCKSNIVINSTDGGNGGFVGLCENSVTFKDCVSNAVIKSSGGNNSGFVGWSRSNSHTISFEGCVFSGKLLKNNGNGGSNGCFVGWKGDAKTVTLNKCLCAPAALSNGETYASEGSFAFSRQHDDYAATLTDCYYIGEPFGSAQGTQQIFSAKPGNENTYVNATGYSVYEYPTAEFTVYFDGGFSYKNCFTYKGTVYGEPGSIIVLGYKSATEGNKFLKFTATSGNVAGNTNFYFGWDNAVISAEYGPLNPVATWRNYDGSFIYSQTYESGQETGYNGSAPYHPNTNQYVYRFSGWSPNSGDPIFYDTDFTAQFTEVVREYKLYWKNADGTILAQSKGSYNGPNEYPGDVIPSKPSTAEYTYIFTGWQISSITSDTIEDIIIYSPIFDAVKNKYTVTWKNYDGTVIKTENIEYGKTPSCNTPTRTADNKYSYTFKEWSPTVSTVTGNVTYTAVFTRTPNASNFSQNGNTYTIHNETGWLIFLDCLADSDNYNGFVGKTVKLEKNISVNYMAGSYSNNQVFGGTFDGCEKTISVNYPVAPEWCAPFSYTNNATIRNLNVTGTIKTSNKYSAGLVARAEGTTNIENCHVSVTIKSNVTNTSHNDGTHGGFIAATVGGNATIKGCVFDGSFVSENTSNKTSCWGGFVGWNNTAVSVENCIFAPADVSTINDNDSYTFVRRGGNCTFTNSYCTQTLGTAQGKQAHTITAGNYVTINDIALTGDTTYYNVSGITAYSGGGLDYNNNLYYGNGNNVSLTLSHADRKGYTFNGYTASAGTLDGTKLTMPDSNVTINANFNSGTYFDASTGTLTLKGTVSNNYGVILPDGVNKDDVLYIVVDSAGATLPIDSSYLFYNLKNVISIDLTRANTSGVTSMAYMFKSCNSLTTLNLSGLDTSSVTTMEYMFHFCRSLTTLDLSGLNTSKVKTMEGMFYLCESLINPGISGLNTSSVTTIAYMFCDCFALTTLDLSGLNTSSVTNMKYMFGDCIALTTLELSRLNTSSVTDMGYMFYGCKSLTNPGISELDTSKVTSMSSMFYGCKSLTNPGISGLNTSSVTTMFHMFENCVSLTTLDLSRLNVSKVETTGFLNE